MQEAQVAMDELKRLVTKPPVLKALDYKAAKVIKPPPQVFNHGLVILAVDSSIHGSGWVLYQIWQTDRHPILFESCMFNRIKSKYSQLKVELYGIFQAVKELCHQIWGIHFSMEVDAKFLEQMIKEPDLSNAPMTHWVSYIQLFDFSLRHVSAEKGKAQDGLSRKQLTNEDSDESDAESYLDKFFGFSIYATNDLENRSHSDALAVLTTSQYNGMAEYLGYDAVTAPQHVALAPFVVVSMGTFESERAKSISCWAALVSDEDHDSWSWDANVRNGMPQWHQLMTT
jgi:hypothetical protein